MKIFYLPDLGEGLAEAEIREWYVKVGDEVKVDQPLVSMETAKAVVDVPSPYAGKIVELHGAVNTIIQTGAPFITFETDAAVEDKGSVVGTLEVSEKKWQDGDAVVTAAKKVSSTVKVMPAARVLANELNIDLANVKASGPQGLITVADVKACMSAGRSPSATTTRLQAGESLHGVRRIMAQIMTKSHQEVAPVTLIEDADITDLPRDQNITVRLLQAIIAAAKAEPALNAWFDGLAMTRQLVNEVHIGLAVDTTEGLLVPVIKQAETLSVERLRQSVDDYKKAAESRSLPATALHGATITLSNFGMIAGRYATPIIVPPAVAILGCGRLRDAALPRDGKLIVGRLLPLSLTFDHRAVTGGEATRFLRAILLSLSR